mgnify:CR=1 FL=1
MYQWIVVVGGVFSFIAAMGIGANDVANAYATAVGSKALTMTQAVVLATIFEASGAILMGSHVTKTIRKGIADYECFEDDPGALMYGCMWVCFSVGAWLFIASRYEMPVSTTHSCVGGMIGMTMALKGSKCVTWYEERDTFPFVGGVSGIILSWVISPVMSAVFATTLFGIIRTVILRNDNSFDRTAMLFPLIVGGVVTLNSYYIIYKGAKGLGLDDTPLGVATAWSFGIGALAGGIMIPVAPNLKNFVLEKMDKLSNAIMDIENSGNSKHLEVRGQQIPVETDLEPVGCCDSLVKHVNDNLKVKLEDVVAQDERVTVIHDNAEKFEARTEEYFKYLQVFTAIFDSFSHGANDVANAIGPFAAIYMIHKDGEVNKESEMTPNTAYGILSMGGVGIGLGLVLYGYKIMKAIGLKLCKITPSRGTCIELASAIVIITGSRLEIPLSTTHCQIGATMGVAALEDPRGCSGINCSIVAKTIAGWVITLIVVGGTTALLTAQGAHSPEVGKHCDDSIFFNSTTNYTLGV